MDLRQTTGDSHQHRLTWFRNHNHRSIQAALATHRVTQIVAVLQIRRSNEPPHTIRRLILPTSYYYSTYLIFSFFFFLIYFFQMAIDICLSLAIHHYILIIIFNQQEN